MELVLIENLCTGEIAFESESMKEASPLKKALAEYERQCEESGCPFEG